MRARAPPARMGPGAEGPAPPMKVPPLLRTCLVLWLAGLLTMWIARAVFACELSSLSFRLAAGLWAAGGLGYVGLGLGRCLARGAGPPRERS